MNALCRVALGQGAAGLCGLRPDAPGSAKFVSVLPHPARWLNETGSRSRWGIEDANELFVRRVQKQPGLDRLFAPALGGNSKLQPMAHLREP